MAPILPLVLAVLAAFATTASAGQQSRHILPPTQVSPASSGFHTTTLRFELQWPIECPCTVTVVNGAPGRGPQSGTRVSAGSVWVDGAALFMPKDISSAQPVATATLDLSRGAHEFRIEVVGQSTSFVTIELTGLIATANLSTARAHHTATLMPDGTVVLAGGDGASGVLNSAERLSASGESTEAAAPMLNARRGHSAALLPGGSVAFAGGTDAGAGLASVEVWTAGGAVAGHSLDEVRSGHTATPLLDGRVLILGGRNASGHAMATGVLVDPRPDAFTDNTYDATTATLTNLGSVLQVARAGHTATLLPDGRVLVAGGHDGATELSSMEIFDPAGGTSALLSISLATARSHHTATVRSNGDVVIIGGRSGTAFLPFIERVGPSLDIVETAGTINLARAGHTATVIRNGEILIAGGMTPSGITANTELGPAPPPDAVAPAIVFASPVANATGVERGSVIGLHLSEPLEPLSVSSQSIELRNSSGEVIGASIGISDHGLLVAIRPDALLSGDSYTVTVNGVTDRAGLALAPFSFSFTIVPPPVITAIAPLAGTVGTLVTASGSGFGEAADDHRLSFGTLLVPVVPVDANTLQFTVPSLPVGSYPIALRTRGGVTNASAAFTIVNPAPTLTAIEPATVEAGSPAFTLRATGTGFVDGATVTVGTATLSATVLSSTSLQVEVPAAVIAVAATLSVRVTNAAPGGGASNDLTLTVQATGPALTSIKIFPRGMSLSAGAEQQFTAQALYANGAREDVTTAVSWLSSQTDIVTIDAAGLSKALAEGTSTITVSFGGQSATADVRVYAGEAIPPDPSLVATDLNPTQATPMSDATRFLYEGDNAMQRGVAAGTIEARRAAVVRGVIRGRDGAPIIGARVTIADHPELGYTLSRLDGGYDLAVNGGGSLIVRFTRDGLLPADRRIAVPPGEMVVAADVTMIALDPVVTTIDLRTAGAMQVARGSVSSDEDGSRQSTVLFAPGTVASLRLPDGSTQPITSLNVRATEYTVGAAGPASMPGALPRSSAYTYAVELSVDEAIAAGATSVEFSAPVPVYLENFLNVPVGMLVPTGHYDRVRGAWAPLDDGVVIRILSIDDTGRARLDLDGDGSEDTAERHAFLGISDAERSTLATLYSAGQSLWRMAVSHFSTIDGNYGSLFPADSDRSPDLNRPIKDQGSHTDAETCGSIIECQEQVLGERLPLTGTPFTLNYRSDRVPGRLSNRLSIPLTEETAPASLMRIDLEVSIAGRVTRQSFSGVAGQFAEFEWDGRDAYGRLVEGPQQAHVTIQHIYPVVYPMEGLSFSERTRLFGAAFVGIPGAVVPGREGVPAPTRWTETLGPPPRQSTSVGGWSLDVHHVYDHKTGSVLLGTGGRRVADLRVDGPPVTGIDPDLPDLSFLFEVVVERDGIYYLGPPLSNTNVVRKVPNQAPVVVATLPSRRAFTVDVATQSIYYGRCPSPATTMSLFRIVQAGAPQLVASAPIPAGRQCFDSGIEVARAPDGAIYLSEQQLLYQWIPDGPLNLVGNYPTFAEKVTVSPDGVVYRSSFVPGPRGYVIERVEPDGALTRVAGTGLRGAGGDQGIAVNVDIGIPWDVAVGTDGTVYFTDFTQVGDRRNRLRRVSTAGILTNLAGERSGWQSLARRPDGTPVSSFAGMVTIETGPDGAIYFFDRFGYRFPSAFAETSIFVASEDGTELYEFNSAGRHLRTTHTLTGATLYTFGYDANGYLSSVTDGDGLQTRIHRTPDGRPTAIEAPFGQITTVTQDAHGWLSRIVAPGDRTTTLTMTPSGLLTNLVDPNGHPHDFTYSSTGLLEKDANAAGGSETLARTPLAGRSWEATRTSEMGRVRKYVTEVLPDNRQRLTITEADGTVSVQTTSESGNSEVIAADGTRTVTTMGPDPRFGRQVPVPISTTVTTPSGLTLTQSFSRFVETFNPPDHSTLLRSEFTTINGRVYSTVFSGATRTFTTTTPAGRVTTTSIDAQGRVIRTQVGSMIPLEFIYDPQGRLTETRQGPRRSTISYDAAGRPSVLTDALTRAVWFDYDAADRVSTQTLPDTRTIGFAYDNNSNVTSLTPPSRPAHTFTYTPIDLTASYTPPGVAGTGPTGYLFNLDRQPTEAQRPDGQTTLFTYGETSGRLTSVTFSRGTATYGYDMAGRVSSIGDPGGVNLSFAYDGALPLSETWSGAVQGAVTRTFTSNFELATESLNGADLVSFGYDNDRLLTSAGALTITRHPQNGLVTGTTLGVTTEAHEYNEFGEPSRQTAVVESTPVFDVQFQRDDLGRITRRIEVVDGITRVFQYGYDLAGRIEAVTRDAALVARYTYDPNGNRLTAEGEAHGGGLAITATYDDQDRLRTYGDATYTYTANGELESKSVGGQTTSYVYDTLGNLIQVNLPNGNVITYTIDGRGRRVGKSINGTRVKAWLYANQWRPVAELDGDGNVVSRFVYGTRNNVPEYIVRGGVTYRIFSDHLGSPRVIVDASTGTVAQRLDFHVFGEIIQDSNPEWQPFGFAGGLYDTQTGLIRFGRRDYDPVVGRWASKDPIGFGGKDTNVYSYVFSAPTNNTDPTGELAWVAAGAVIGAAVNMTMTAVANGGQVTGRQLAAAAVSGLISGAVGAVAGPLGGTIAKGLTGAASSGLTATAAAAAISAAGGAAGQAAANWVDPCNASSVANAALWAGVGGGVAKGAFPTKNLNSWAQASAFGPSTLSGLIGSPNAFFNLGSFATSAGVGGAANFPILNPF